MIFQAAANKVGRRGSVLIIIGTVWVISGFGYVNDKVSRFSQREPSPIEFMDYKFWGFVWIIGGLIGIFLGVRHKRRSDVVGFAAVIIPVIVWTLFYWYSFILFNVTGGVYGQGNTWRGGLAYALIYFLIQIISGWEDTNDPMIKFKPGSAKAS
jgi:hypothetical protein